MEGRCMKCKEQVEIKDPVQEKTKKGSLIVKGICGKCGTKVCRMGKLE